MRNTLLNRIQCLSWLVFGHDIIIRFTWWGNWLPEDFQKRRANSVTRCWTCCWFAKYSGESRTTNLTILSWRSHYNIVLLTFLNYNIKFFVFYSRKKNEIRLHFDLQKEVNKKNILGKTTCFPFDYYSIQKNLQSRITTLMQRCQRRDGTHPTADAQATQKERPGNRPVSLC